MSPFADVPPHDTPDLRPLETEMSRRTFVGAATGAGLVTFTTTHGATAGHDLIHEERTAMALTQTDATPTNDTAMQRADELLR